MTKHIQMNAVLRKSRAQRRPKNLKSTHTKPSSRRIGDPIQLRASQIEDIAAYCGVQFAYRFRASVVVAHQLSKDLNSMFDHVIVTGHLYHLLDFKSKLMDLGYVFDVTTNDKGMVYLTYPFCDVDLDR